MKANPTAAVASPYRRLTPTVWQHLARALWHALEDIGQRRGARSLEELARRWDTLDPHHAARLRAAALYRTASARD